MTLSDPLAANSVQIPLKARISLAHGVVEAIAQAMDVDVLHIKGYATAAGMYPAGRISHDVDLLVRPSQTDILIDAMRAHGWILKTSFNSGSIFQHACSMWHPSWGYCDVHRLFPGITIDREAAFEILWHERISHQIAQRECSVPSPTHQALIITLHGGRDPGRGNSDMNHLREFLGKQSWEELAQEARIFGAEVAWAAGNGTLETWSTHKDYALWRSLSQGAGRRELFVARWKSQDKLGGRFRLLFSAMTINQDHLRLRLRREITLRDYLTEFGVKFKAALREVTPWNRPTKKSNNV